MFRSVIVSYLISNIHNYFLKVERRKTFLFFFDNFMILINDHRIQVRKNLAIRLVPKDFVVIIFGDCVRPVHFIKFLNVIWLIFCFDYISFINNEPFQCFVNKLSHGHKQRIQNFWVDFISLRKNTLCNLVDFN